MITLEHLKQFCSDDETRPTLMQPFSKGEFTYATDGRILIQIPALPEVTNESGPRNAPDLIAQVSPGDERKITEDFSRRDTLRLCPDCGGHGKRDTKGCNGPEEYDCPKCNGKRTEVASIAQTRIAKRWFQNNLLRKIATLPGLLIRPEGGELEPMSFKFDGGIGLIMPMKPEGGVVK